MVDLNGIASGLMLLFEWQVLLAIVLGLVYGIITGAIPGFSTALAISVMLPVTYTLSPLVAMIFLTAVYSGGNFGSAISAVLLNIPGSPQAIVTTLDGYPLTKQGKGEEALGVAVAASSIGNLIGNFFLILVMPIIVMVALRFGPFGIVYGCYTRVDCHCFPSSELLTFRDCRPFWCINWNNRYEPNRSYQGNIWLL